MAIRKFTDVDFSQGCHAGLGLLESGVAVMRGTDADVDYHLLGSPPEYFEFSSSGTNTEIVFKKGTVGVAPPITAGTNIGGEMTQGIGAVGKQIFTVGTDPAFFFSVKLQLATLADYDLLTVGFRGKATTGMEDYQVIANIDTPAELLTRYDSLAAINHETTVLHSVFRSAAGTGVDTTSTTALVAATAATLTVKVSAAGLCTFFKDGTELQGMVSSPMATGTIVGPWLYMVRNGTGTVGTLQLIRWTCGYQ